MEQLIYLLKVSTCTFLFFGFYLLILNNLTFFKLNRFYLLGTLFLSFAIPALQITVEKEIKTMETQVPIAAIDVNNVGAVGANGIEVLPMPISNTSFDWFSTIPYIYLGIVAALLLNSTWKLLRLIGFTKDYSEPFNGLKLISKEKGFTNCSFFNYVFINKTNLSETDLQVLLRHEQVHANQYHSIDKMLLMFVKAVLWFNPVIYLFDKALEQTHEYEADEATSQSFGNNAYASLLLRLSVSKGDMPFIHNFVKSPLKERIKMLFNSKSKNMKKLSYFFALPISLGLVWLFAVQVVYAQSKQNVALDIQPIAAKSEAIKGKVVKVEKGVIGNVFELLSNGKNFRIEANGYSDKINGGDEVVVYLSGTINSFKQMDKNGKVIATLDKPVYMLSKITTAGGKLIYERVIEKHAFGFEVNKARYATSKIKSIQKSTDGTLHKIVLNDGLFTINLNLSAQNLKNNNFKVGDEVVVKFIGEKLVSKNTYSTDKMIVLYSQPKKYELKNEFLFDRFYSQDGRQKVAAAKLDYTQDLIPKIISSTKITGDVQSKIVYIEDAVIEIRGNRLKAKFVKWDRKNNILTAYKANNFNGDQGVISDEIVFDLKTGTCKTFDSSIDESRNTVGDYNLKQKDLLNEGIRYSALDSVRLSKDKSIVSLYGKAKVYFKNMTIDADEITFNKMTNSGNAKNLTLTNESGIKVKGSSAKFDLNGKVEIWQDSDDNQTVEP